MKIILYSQKITSENSNYIQLCINELLKYKTRLFVLESLYNDSKKKINFPNKIHIIKQIAKVHKIDFLICFGGDGTMLKAAHLVGKLNIPITGINTGRLGFLANIPKQNITDLITSIYEKKFHISPRSLIKVFTKPKLKKNIFQFALNEVSISEKNHLSMISINTYINNEFLNTYWGDGLIVSTPTGSTAHSLSCGGPIVMPDSNNFIITPISSHNLNVRPLVFSDDNIIQVHLDQRFKSFNLSIDGQTERITNKHIVFIQKESFKINFLITEKSNYFDTLRNKLLWGLDKRNTERDL